MNFRIAVTAALIILVLATIAAWATDFVTLQGEWTVYTADCKDGTWRGSTCSGRLVASERYRFRALKVHREVLFWTSGDNRPSGRFADCEVQDGRSWTCPATPELARTVTRKMTLGVPTDDASEGALSVHRIPKWKWEALRHGIPAGRTALN